MGDRAVRDPGGGLITRRHIIQGTFCGTASCRLTCRNDQAAPGIFHHAASIAVSFAFAVLMALILVVEDDVFIRQNAGWTIDDLGHGTLLAEDLAGALLHLSASPHIDALFVDIRLATLALGGYDVANRAVGMRPGLRVLYTSGSTLTPEMTGQFVDGGQFLQKPYSIDQLGDSVGALLH